MLTHLGADVAIDGLRLRLACPAGLGERPADQPSAAQASTAPIRAAPIRAAPIRLAQIRAAGEPPAGLNPVPPESP